MKHRFSRTARDIRDASTLDLLGWQTSIGVFRAIRASSAAILAGACACTSSVATQWLLTKSPERGPQLALLAMAAVGFYTLVTHAIREAFTQRRLQLTQHPFGAFFRALDIPRRAVINAESAHKLIRITVVLLGVGAGVALRLGAHGVAPGHLLLALLLPSTAIVGAAACTFALAAWAQESDRAQFGIVTAGAASMSIGVLFGVPIVTFADFAASIATGGPQVPASELSEIGPAHAAVLCSAVVLGVVTLAALTGISRRQFDAGVRGTADVSAVLLCSRPRSPWLSILRTDLDVPSRRTAMSRMLFMLWAGGSAAVGLRLSVWSTLDMPVPSVVVDRIACVLAFGVALTTAEMMTRWIGPAALSYRWRVSWEGGGTPLRLATSPILLAVVYCSTTAVPIAAASFAFGGDGFLPYAVCLTALACAWISSAVVPAGAPLADGSATTTGSGAVFCICITAATTVLVLTASTLGVGWASTSLVVCTLGGAVWLSRRRILVLPSRPLA